ncbi:MAG TPA: hypothetical protein VMG59_05905 [Phycisphaerae bacterium]|nr:hypothetical protein [Phycisphaerae bacterium]
MNKTRLQIAKADIIRYFDQLPTKVHRQMDIARHLAEQRDFWRLTRSATTQDFIRFLINSGKLTEIVFPFPKPYKREIRYAWGDFTIYEVMLTLKPGCYFSHYTAMAFHGLTEQLPKTTYLNQEQKNAGVSTLALTQKGIDTALRRSVRVSKNVAETDEFRVCIISGKNTHNYGVIEEQVIGAAGNSLGRLRFTRIERTLIDIAVRPIYAGGVFEVLKGYKLAKDKFSMNVLAASLDKLGYVYPYHQVIGFYLERAGYAHSTLDLLRRFPMEFDFYLTHGMKETDYVKEWRLYIPRGF